MEGLSSTGLSNLDFKCWYDVVLVYNCVLIYSLYNGLPTEYVFHSDA